MGNGAIEVHAEFHRVQRIAITMHDERPRRDSPELRRREREIVVARGESAGHLVEAGNLRVSMHMPRAECGALGVRQTVERVLRELRRGRSQRPWKYGVALTSTIADTTFGRAVATCSRVFT